MKYILKAVTALGCLVTAIATPAFCVTPPPEVTVTYAFVPKEQLSDAVKGSREALEIEAAWRQEATAKEGGPPYPHNMRTTKYSIVVFVATPAKFALFGRIGIPVQDPRSPFIVNVRLAPGYSGTYVLDGGGVGLGRGIPPEPKPYEWLEVNIH